ncbi:hypothetical protein ACCAA_890001 [Candidatus Accumulibacter aalborgensis]|uniref:Uncharacterized protein n=1 Tax=Candidatus Accumulibacter aalborgensis TaxID=1860102 RepID=A0A1A8XYT9_9PROT|nr:hypothetical protein ACCAA_890001 [Candidatus Accumulibacter aalborgensis]
MPYFASLRALYWMSGCASRSLSDLRI